MNAVLGCCSLSFAGPVGRDPREGIRDAFLSHTKRRRLCKEWGGQQRGRARNRWYATPASDKTTAAAAGSGGGDRDRVAEEIIEVVPGPC